MEIQGDRMAIPEKIPTSDLSIPRALLAVDDATASTFQAATTLRDRLTAAGVLSIVQPTVAHETESEKASTGVEFADGLHGRADEIDRVRRILVDILDRLEL